MSRPKNGIQIQVFKLAKFLGDPVQCDQMARLFVQYLGILQLWKLAHLHKIIAKVVYTFCTVRNKPQQI